MTTTEMMYVLDKEKECIQRRTDGCDKDCKQCPAYMEPGNLLDAFERIINLIFNVDRNSTRKSY